MAIFLGQDNVSPLAESDHGLCYTVNLHLPTVYTRYLSGRSVVNRNRLINRGEYIRPDWQGRSEARQQDQRMSQRGA